MAHLQFTVIGDIGFMDHAFDADAIALCRKYNIGGFPMRTMRSGENDIYSMYCYYPVEAEFFRAFHSVVSQYHSTTEVATIE